MDTTTFTLPIKSEYTLEDYDKLPESDIKIELIDGEFRMMPPPIFRHQKVQRRLTKKFDTVLPDNLDIYSNVGIRISNTKYFTPDLVIGYENKLGEDRKDGTPDCFLLVVEIESKSSKAIDRITKYEAYAEAGIQCYVRVKMDDVYNPEVYVYELIKDNNKFSNEYKEVSHAKSGEIVNIYNPIKLSFNPKELVS